jgi:hypothetical protein
VGAWRELESGVDRKAPLSRFYSSDAVAALDRGAESFHR